MVKDLIHDPILLGRVSAPAGADDLQAAQDLLDTLLAHKDGCVGMAGNMIGVYKCIIAFQDGSDYKVMLNPEIIARSAPYEAQESCLSLLGGPRKAVRFDKIKVRYQNENMQTRLKTFTGFTAQIIQHEVDHCNGVLI